MSKESASVAKSGFHGAVGTLPLVDLLQVWSMNRFSGLVTVTQRGRTGHLYFVEGEVVHAEADEWTGEPAVLEIIGWADGTFELIPNTTTLHRTIQKRLSHLLLDAHRVLDERRRDAGRLPTTAPRPQREEAAPARDAGKPNVVEQLRALRGVARVVRFGADGRPAGEPSPEAEQLAAKGLYLAMTHAGAIAEAFGLRDLSVAALQSEREGLVLVHSQGQYVCLELAPDAAADQVASQVRALLVRQAGR